MVLNLWSRLNSLFGTNAEKIMADLPNFTNVQPQVQISELYKYTGLLKTDEVLMEDSDGILLLIENIKKILGIACQL
jgi:hypothetical protein